MMTNMQLPVKIKKLTPDAVLPVYASAGAACFDLVATSVERDSDNSAVYGTGLATELPQGYVMLVFSRSGHGFKQGLRLANCVGVIDSDYRGEIKCKLHCDKEVGDLPKIGERIAQAIVLPFPQVSFQEVEELAPTERGDGGFGSTGTNANNVEISLFGA